MKDPADKDQRPEGSDKPADRTDITPVGIGGQTQSDPPDNSGSNKPAGSDPPFGNTTLSDI